MSLYSDLTEVLTPYANKINELNGSLETGQVSPKAKETLLQLFEMIAYKETDTPRTLLNRLEYFLDNPNATAYPIYAISEPLIFTGDSEELIRTGITPLAFDRDFTITYTFTMDGNYANGTYIFSCTEPNSPYWGIQHRINNNKFEMSVFGASRVFDTSHIDVSEGGVIKSVITHNKNTINCRVIVKTQKKIDTYYGNSVKSIDSQLLIGGNGVIGTLNDFKWYDGKLTETQITEYIGS